MANTKVQSEQIEDGSITADKLADGTIVAAELADNAVTTAKINADAVTGAKIADDAIDSEHYTDGSIDTAHIADAQITVAKMAANSVDSDQYVDGSIDTVHLGDLQVTTAKIANGNISTAKIADNAVTSAKIDTNIDIAGTFDVTGATTLDSTLAVAGDANFDSGTLFVDVSGNNVGVGATSLQSWAKLEVAGTAGAQTGAKQALYVRAPTTTANEGVGIRMSAASGSNEAVGIIGMVNNASGNSGSMTFHTYNGGADIPEAMRIDNTGNVGIGITSPATTLHLDASGGAVLRMQRTSANASNKLELSHDGTDGTITSTNALNITASYVDIGGSGAAHANTDDLIVGAYSGNHGIQINAENTGNSSIFFGDQNSTIIGQIEYVHASDYMAFITGLQQKLRIDSDGLKFGTDSAAANALDDYEEGSWTIAVSSSDPGSMTATPSNAYGWYVKVGKVVHVGGSFDLSVSNGQGTMRITGLPYACSSNGTRPLFTGQVGYTINVVPQPGYVTMGNGSSESYLDVWKEGNNSRYNIVDWDSGGRMNFQITYEAN